jgi:hypothetical protein
MRTGVGVSDAMKALRVLDVDARTLAEIERSANVYEEARTACRANSFPGGTKVVLADGSRKAIRDVRFGDLLLATDPVTGRTQGEPVTRTFHHTTVDLVDVALADGGRLTSTPGHRFFVTGRGWTLASDLHAGDSLRSPDGILRTVSAALDRNDSTPRTVYDLTVSGLHTFYAVAGSSPVLIHNCNDIVFDEEKFPGQAHTLDEHVRPEKEEAVDLARAKTEKFGRDTPNSVWVNQETAQKIVDFALKDKAGKITKWLRERKSNELTWRGTFGPKDSSLGTVYYANGTEKVAGNGFTIKIVRAPDKHKYGYYVQTCFPN